MDKETQRILGKIQRQIDKGESLSAAASKVGWRRQRAHAHLARGNLTIEEKVFPKTKVDAPEIYRKFGKVVAHMIEDKKYGSTLLMVATFFVQFVADIDDKKAYNVVITRFANWILDKAPHRNSVQFLLYCSNPNTSLLRKVCVARYLINA